MSASLAKCYAIAESQGRYLREIETSTHPRFALFVLHGEHHLDVCAIRQAEADLRSLVAADPEAGESVGGSPMTAAELLPQVTALRERAERVARFRGVLGR